MSARTELAEAKREVAEATAQADKTQREVDSARTLLQKATDALNEAIRLPAIPSVIADLTKLKVERKIQFEIVSAANTIAQTRKTIAESKEQVAETRYQLEQLKDLEIPDENIEIPIIADFTIPVINKKIKIDTGQKASVPLSMLALASIDPGSDVIPDSVLTALDLVGLIPEEGAVSGPAGTFTKGNSVSANVIATSQITAPSITSSGTVVSAGLNTGDALISGTATVTGNLSVGAYLTTGALKAFDIKHPTKEGKRLRYACLEGPEAGVYVRGKTSEGIIPLPDYWSGLVDENTITVHLTPTNMDQTLVVNNVNGLTIQVLGNHRLPYYYHVMAERKDIDQLTVEYDA